MTSPFNCDSALSAKVGLFAVPAILVLNELLKERLKFDLIGACGGRSLILLIG
jgi:hypothetical protein